jgi:hypothetical protein
MSWYHLLGILKERNTVKSNLDAQPPRACPNDGEPLLAKPDGTGLYCPFDGWKYPEDAETAIR